MSRSRKNQKSEPEEDFFDSLLNEPVSEKPVQRPTKAAPSLPVSWPKEMPVLTAEDIAVRSAIGQEGKQTVWQWLEVALPGPGQKWLQNEFYDKLLVLYVVHFAERPLSLYEALLSKRSAKEVAKLWNAVLESFGYEIGDSR